MTDRPDQTSEERRALWERLKTQTRSKRKWERRAKLAVDEWVADTIRGMNKDAGLRAEIRELRTENIRLHAELAKRDADRPTTADCSECGLSWSFRCCPDCGAPARVSSPEPEGPTQPTPRVWNAGDPEPDAQTVLRDVWPDSTVTYLHRTKTGWWWSDEPDRLTTFVPPNCNAIAWPDVFATAHGPLTEVRPASSVLPEDPEPRDPRCRDCCDQGYCSYGYDAPAPSVRDTAETAGGAA